MMRLPTFSYLGARSLDDAVRALADDPSGTRLVAGGTDLWPNLKRRNQTARTVVGLRRVVDLRGIEGDPVNGVSIGAMTTLSTICRDPMLKSAYPGFVRAVASISSPVLRNMGTIGGNLCLDTRCTYYDQNEEWRRSIGYCMKELGEICWVAPGQQKRCYATTSTDAAPLLCAIGASVVLVSTEGERAIPVTDLYRDDGIDYLTKRHEEVVTRILLPPIGNWRSTYWKLRRRASIDFPVLGVGAAVRRETDGSCAEVRVFLGAVSSAPRRVAVEPGAFATSGDPASGLAAVAAAARRAAMPFDNTDYFQKWRKDMAGIYTEGALRELLDLPPSVMPCREGLFALEV